MIQGVHGVASLILAIYERFVDDVLLVTERLQTRSQAVEVKVAIAAQVVAQLRAKANVILIKGS
ncbi:hypothetical protein AQ745_25040 [Burkholderia pseudomallei]|nr:hypothetical protein AQ743_12295 [Burkholderia pseudomallei]OMS59925.1 hypothetical protein AQ744_03450 [Burkholderia pseudomallei]OMS63298.1 hypothetical protein AQ745_25040 [Burkholderia pseudomallei]OMS80951.1 hypothetical protein AQ747_04950 [Burkholderia pseudomallei]